MPHLPAAAILFDMDGTLIDSNVASEATWQRWCARHHVDIEHVRRVHHGRLPAETISLVAPHLDAAREALAIYAEQEGLTEGIHPIRGAHAFYASVPRHQAALVTAATRRIVHLRLGLVGLAVPEVCVTADDVAASKPDPAGYLEAARRLRVAAHDCVVFEDAPAGLLAAHRAGMRAVAILSNYSEAALRAELPFAAFPIACVADFEGLAFGDGRIVLPG